MSITTTEPLAAGSPERRPSAATKSPVLAVLKPLASLQLTVILFAFSVGLVFLGTLAQKGVGIWTVVDQYFWSWAVLVDTQHILEFGKIFFGLPTDLQAKSWAKIPYPGGKLLGGLLLLNLLAAHALRFRLTWKRSGIFILHGGIVALFVGEFVTREFQVEQQMHIPEGGSANFAVDTRNYELAFVDGSAADTDKVVTIPAKQLRKAQRDKQRITHAELPVDVEVLQYMPNSDFANPASAPSNPATQGAGVARVVVEEPEVSGVDTTNRMDVPSAYVRLFKKGTDEDLGTYLVSLLVSRPQVLKGVGEKTTIELRNTRYYKPFTMHLIDFKFDRYVGTDKPKNYSSDLRLVDPEKGQDRELTIRMNDPLRHRGETFYQSSFTPDEKTTILQVVRNPGWWLPYISCGMVTLGMLVHFGIYLVQFLLRLLPVLRNGGRANRPEATAEPVGTPAPRVGLPAWLTMGLPVAAVGVVLLYIAAAASTGTSDGKLNLREIARIPVVDGGRVKPLDTVARVDLRLISHTEEFKDGKVTRPALKWFLDAASNDPDARSEAAMYRVFRIEHDQVRDLLKLELREGLRYSLKEMAPRYRDFMQAVEKAEARPPKDRDLYEVKLLELNRNIQIYLAIGHRRTPMMLPPAEGKEWRSPADVAEKIVLAQFNAMGGPGGQGFQSVNQMRSQIAMIEDPQRREALNSTLDQMILQASEEARETDPVFGAWDGVLTAYRSGDQKKFDAALADFRQHTEAGVSAADRARVSFEVFLNESGLFYHCTVLYALAILLGLATWVALIISPPVGNAMRWSVFWWLFAVFAVHTFTLISRMYLMDRPLVFVTNLHSSAVFIGWVVIAVCLIVELLYPLGIGNVVGAVLGFTTSMVAHNLATSGDTLEMMEAVLDTNFWLATHVTTVTAGYGATYIAGVVGLLYVALYLLPPEVALRKKVTFGAGATTRTLELGRVLGQIIYGVVCFATLLSFVGTVLGGIWADQSWGRFWGWDPKENGAVLIVIWNSLILHARWCGLVKDRGMAVLSLVGVMITTWSWFGTNQLGVGLHAYGFSNKLAFGCAVTWVAFTVPVIAGMIPWPQIWKSAKTV